MATSPLMEGSTSAFDKIWDVPDTARGRAIRDVLKQENEALKAQISQLRAGGGDGGGAALSTPSQAAHDATELAKHEIVPAKYYADPVTGRGDYPRKNDLSVLKDLEHEIRIYDEDQVKWCIQQMGECDPDLGGEETLDKDIAPGVEVVKLAAIVPPDDEQCGAMAVSQPGAVVGPTRLWFKTVNTAGGFGGLRGRAEWLVPPVGGSHGCDDSCRVLYVHGGSFMWYSGVDEIYQPLTSRIALSAGMPVLAIDYRLMPEFTATEAVEDCLEALVWMGSNGPKGASKARKLFISGDSSGGGTVLSVLLAARDGLPVSGTCLRHTCSTQGRW